MAESPHPEAEWPTSRVATLLYEVLHLTAETRTAMARRLGLNPSEVDAMEHLMAEPMGPVELSRRLHMTSASATVLVDRLEEAGHVAREADPEDRRRRVVRPTDAGCRRRHRPGRAARDRPRRRRGPAHRARAGRRRGLPRAGAARARRACAGGLGPKRPRAAASARRSRSRSSSTVSPTERSWSTRSSSTRSTTCRRGSSRTSPPTSATASNAARRRTLTEALKSSVFVSPQRSSRATRTRQVTSPMSGCWPRPSVATRLDDDQIQGLVLGASIHDLGKISISHSTLGKSGELTDAEWEISRPTPPPGGPSPTGSPGRGRSPR